MKKVKMRQSTLEKLIKAGKVQPKSFVLEFTGTQIQFHEAPNNNYLHYIRFEDEYGRYLGSLDSEGHRKKLRQLQRWVNKCLKTGE